MLKRLAIHKHVTPSSSAGDSFEQELHDLLLQREACYPSADALETALRQIALSSQWSHTEARERWHLHGLLGASTAEPQRGYRPPDGGCI
jgi:hypothetical protein